MKLIFLIGFAVLQTGLFAQKRGQLLIDSILNELPGQPPDTNKVKSLTKIAETYIQVNPVKGISYASDGLAMAGRLQWKKGIAKLENAMCLLVVNTDNNKLAGI